MSPQKVGQKVYEERTIIRAFEYFAISRSLYSRLHVDYKLPNEKTLSKLTSKVSNIDDDKFLVNIFSNLPEKQQRCIVFVDEVYVKPLLQYHGGTIFGKAANYPDSLATTVLAIMIKCLFGGPAFLVKMIPVFKLDSKFLYEQVTPIIRLIVSSGGHVTSVIVDNNCINQTFFKLFATEG